MPLALLGFLDESRVHPCVPKFWQLLFAIEQGGKVGHVGIFDHAKQAICRHLQRDRLFLATHNSPQSGIGCPALRERIAPLNDGCT